jgi:hypothetical protein
MSLTNEPPPWVIVPSTLLHVWSVGVPLSRFASQRLISVWRSSNVHGRNEIDDYPGRRPRSFNSHSLALGYYMKRFQRKARC